MKIKMTSLFRALALASFAFVCLGVPIKAYLQSLSAVSEPAPSQSKGQAYPTRPIRSIMTVAGGADVVARLVAQGLTEALGQPVVVEAQAGAGGAIGAETVARAAPDGHTIMLASASTVVMSRFLSKSARLDPIKDFTPITKAFETVALVVTSPSLPVDSVQELIEYARRNPGKLSFGTSGVGTTHPLSGEAIRLLTGIDWIHVPYKGGPPVLTDLLSGQIQVGFSILATAAPFVSSGKIKLLAVNGARGAPARRDRQGIDPARGALEGRGHRVRDRHQHARGAHRDHPARHRAHEPDRRGDRHSAGIARNYGREKSSEENRAVSGEKSAPFAGKAAAQHDGRQLRDRARAERGRGEAQGHRARRRGLSGHARHPRPGGARQGLRRERVQRRRIRRSEAQRPRRHHRDPGVPAPAVPPRLHLRQPLEGDRGADRPDRAAGRVPHRTITWVIESDDEASLQAPADLKLERAPRGKKVEDMLLSGEVDAMVAPNLTRAIGEGDPRVARLFPDYKAIEADYYRRTGIFPIMHVTTVPSTIVARHPWVVESLVLAFEEAKQLAYQRLANPRNVPLAWFRSYWEDERALLGADPWEYGLSEINKRNYDTLVGWVHEQVLTGKRPTLGDQFPKEAFELELPLPRMHEIDYRF